MKIFIDESGSFSGFHSGSLGAVGALSIPEGRLEFIEKKYLKIRKHLPRLGDEVKGRLLEERHVAKVVSLLARNEVIFEVSVIDLGLHTAEAVSAYKEALIRSMNERIPRFNEATRPIVETSLEELARTPINLFLQTITLFETIHRVISHIPLYYVQRRPKELARFEWIVDGKDRTKVTNWEKWWAFYAIGALSTKSRYHPAPMLDGADYSYYGKFRYVGEDGEEGTNLSLLLKELRFSSEAEIGLELVDILTNAIRRALTGTLSIEGWRDIVRTMIHRKEHYIGLVRLHGASQIPQESAPYVPALRHFWSGGKPMLTKHVLDQAEEEQA